MQLKGSPLGLDVYECSEVLTNKHFKGYQMPDFEKMYLPACMRPFTELTPSGMREFIADDNRGAVCPLPTLKMDGTDFYLSVKGVGSTVNPFINQVLGKTELCSLIKDPKLNEKIFSAPETAPRYLTGELWLRGSPYGGQGLQHAVTSLNVSEMADLTSIHGFRIAPLVKIVFLPLKLEEEVKKVYWYRRFSGRMVQETRLVPSNIRIYFHSGSTVGRNIHSLFDLFGLDSNEKALEFLENFVRSGIAFLTLFSRSTKANEDGTFSGLDFYDVWLDKDAVLSPDGTIYFVDLEGLEWVTVQEKNFAEKIDDQIYRSLYEFMYAYEQIERERAARFGAMLDRKAQFEYLLKKALRDDEVVDLVRVGESLKLYIGNILGEQRLTRNFSIIDWVT